MARKKDLAGLAALGALGYALSRGKGGADVPVEDRVGVEADEAPAPTGMSEATKFAPTRSLSAAGRAPTRSLSAAGRAPTAPSRISVDDELGMTRGTRPRDPRDLEAGRGSVNPTMPQVASTTEEGMRGYAPRRTPQVASTTEEGMRGYAPRRTPQVASTTEEGMRGYAPRRTPGVSIDVNRPGTRVRYENEDTSDMAYKKGGKTKVSSASRRADGIATKGKTRGRYL